MHFPRMQQGLTQAIHNAYTRNMTGDQIKAAREQVGESQAEFGARFGVNQSTIARWEMNGIPDRGPTRMAVESILARIGRRHRNANCIKAQD